ncbi:hypothetical protein R9X47_09505 [Wukongibacter baidiensis]|uniref:hypothetical protein n=1 Tax=Wukongibacter baidiensis TaxID=1723361 RepID=UPI003D7F4496
MKNLNHERLIEKSRKRSTTRRMYLLIAIIMIANFALVTTSFASNDQGVLNSVAIEMKNSAATANEVATALNNAYNATEEEAVKALKAAEYEVEEVAAVIKDAYNESTKGAAKLLKKAGYGAKSIAKALDSAYKASAKSIAKALKSAGYGFSKVISALNSIGKSIGSWINKIF